MVCLHKFFLRFLNPTMQCNPYFESTSYCRYVSDILEKRCYVVQVPKMENGEIYSQFENVEKLEVKVKQGNCLSAC